MNRTLTEQEREDLLIDFTTSAMVALIPTFGVEVEAKRHVLAHKAFLMGDAMLRAFEQRGWE